MADLLKQANATITDATGAAILDGAASKAYTIISLSICNTHASNDETFSVFRSDAGGSTNKRFIYDTQSLPAKETFMHPHKIVLEASQELWVASPSGSATIDGVIGYLEQDV